MLSVMSFIYITDKSRHRKEKKDRKLLEGIETVSKTDKYIRAEGYFENCLGIRLSAIRDQHGSREFISNQL